MKNETRQLGPVRLELFPMIKSQITFSDFCSPISTIDFKVHEGFLKNSLTLFSFTYGNFIFEAKIRDGMIFIMRNGQYQHSEQYLGDGSCHVALQWTIDSIGCGIVSPDSSTDMNHHLRAVRTPITIPPVEIVNILRKENLLSNPKYENMDAFFATIIDSLHCCQEDIRRHGAERLFWKKTNEKTWQPVDEPDISRGVATFLSIYGALKNFDVTCEPIAGAGSMDLHLVAPVADSIGKIAIEAKKAESNDLINGFKTQLPAYMERIGTNYGIYLVYWLKSPDYPFPSSHNTYAELEIEKLHLIKRSMAMRTVGMNLSKEVAPSLKKQT
ncbi:MAG: hypothetical protein Q8M34_03840 [Thermodesulfovibrionales bacterium]|nr:hypothetical protein [Thermodesulfovibrionales bacterium]